MALGIQRVAVTVGEKVAKGDEEVGRCEIWVNLDVAEVYFLVLWVDNDEWVILVVLVEILVRVLIGVRVSIAVALGAEGFGELVGGLHLLPTRIVPITSKATQKYFHTSFVFIESPENMNANTRKNGI